MGHDRADAADVRGYDSDSRCLRFDQADWCALVVGCEHDEIACKAHVRDVAPETGPDESIT